MVKVTLSGNTYGVKEDIKGAGFKWNPSIKAWVKVYEDKADATDIASRWAQDGVKGIVSECKEKRYMVKESWIFNLESMHDRIHCMIDDVREGTLALPIEVAGKTCNDEDDLWAIMDEADALEWAAKRSIGVTGKEYGRIKDIVTWRVGARYVACLASGMSEADAGRCFEDM